MRSDQWRPTNPDKKKSGKKQSVGEYLLQLKSLPTSSSKPLNLPNIDIMKHKSNETQDLPRQRWGEDTSKEIFKFTSSQSQNKKLTGSPNDSKSPTEGEKQHDVEVVSLSHSVTKVTPVKFTAPNFERNPSQLPIMDYQWNLVDKNKKQYAREFLLQLQSQPISLSKPHDLPNLDMMKKFSNEANIRQCHKNKREPAAVMNNEIKSQKPFRSEYAWAEPTSRKFQNLYSQGTEEGKPDNVISFTDSRNQKMKLNKSKKKFSSKYYMPPDEELMKYSNSPLSKVWSGRLDPINNNFREPSRRIDNGRIITSGRDQRDWEQDKEYGYGNRNDRRDRFDPDDSDKELGQYCSRYRSGGGHDRIEVEPEWFSGGPTSRFETIELHGFEDTQDTHNDGKNCKPAKEKISKQNSCRSCLKSDKGKKIKSSLSDDKGTQKKSEINSDDSKQSIAEVKETEETQNANKSSYTGFDLEQLLKMDWIPGLIQNEAPPENSDKEIGCSRFSQWFRKESPLPEGPESENNKPDKTVRESEAELKRIVLDEKRPPEEKYAFEKLRTSDSNNQRSFPMTRGYGIADTSKGLSEENILKDMICAPQQPSSPEQTFNIFEYKQNIFKIPFGGASVVNDGLNSTPDPSALILNEDTDLSAVPPPPLLRKAAPTSVSIPVSERNTYPAAIMDNNSIPSPGENPDSTSQSDTSPSEPIIETASVSTNAQNKKIVKYCYKEDQWSPLNPEGKKKYDREFLLQIQSQPLSLRKPNNLPNLTVIKDKAHIQTLTDVNNVPPAFVNDSGVQFGSKAKKKKAQQTKSKNVKPKAQKRESMEEMIKCLSSLLEKDAELEKVFDWINANIPDPGDLSFARAFLTAIYESCISGSGIKWELNTIKLKLRIPLISRYSSSNEKLQLQALYVAQALSNQLGQPSGLLHHIFDVLYEENVVSDEILIEWEKNDDPYEALEGQIINK